MCEYRVGQLLGTISTTKVNPGPAGAQQGVTGGLQGGHRGVDASQVGMEMAGDGRRWQAMAA